MKALLIADSDEPGRKIAEYIGPYGFDIIQYRSALKAIDNLEEIGPDAVFMSAGDFPRHWKTIAQYIRADTAKDRTVIVLLVNERFTADDADKAVHIGVQAMIDENLSSDDDERKILEVFSRYRHVGYDGPAYDGSVADRAKFLFTNPLNDTIITGRVDGLSPSELRFRPDAPSMTAELAVGSTLDQCSLKVGERLLAPRCRIRKNSRLMILDLLGLSRDETELIASLIAE